MASPVFAHGLKVGLHSLMHPLARPFQRSAGSDAAREVRRVSAISGAGWFENHGVVVHFRPACFVRCASTGACDAARAIRKASLRPRLPRAGWVPARHSGFAQGFDVKFNRFRNNPARVFKVLADREAARKVRYLPRPRWWGPAQTALRISWLHSCLLHSPPASRDAFISRER
jgi:hypothetical protein